MTIFHFIKLPSINFHEYQFSSSQAITCGQTEGAILPGTPQDTPKKKGAVPGKHK
jgi:hypothetical protein